MSSGENLYKGIRKDRKGAPPSTPMYTDPMPATGQDVPGDPDAYVLPEPVDVNGPPATSTTVEIGHDVQVVARPAYLRTNSELTVSGEAKDKVPTTDVTDAIYPVSENDTTPRTVEHAYPPSILVEVPEREESRAHRRLRMFAAFCALFLAGWK